MMFLKNRLKSHACQPAVPRRQVLGSGAAMLVFAGTLAFLLLYAPGHSFAATYSNANKLNLRAFESPRIAPIFDTNFCYDDLSYDTNGFKLPVTRQMINGQNGYKQAAYEYTDWISTPPGSSGDYTNTTVSVPANSTAPVPLIFNMETFICFPLVNGYMAARVAGASTYTNDQPPNPDNGSTFSASLYDRIEYIKPGSVKASGGATVGGSIQTVNGVETPRDPNSRYWFDDSGSGPPTISLVPPAGGFKSGSYTITLPGQGIWVYHATVAGGGTIQCRRPDGQLIQLYNTGNVQTINYSPCALDSPSITFTVNVTVLKKPNPPVGAIYTAQCKAPNITGWAYDPNSSSTSIPVDVYEVGGSTPSPGYGDPGGNAYPINRYIANQYNAAVDATYNIKGSHGFSISLPASAINPAQATQFYLYAIGSSTNAYIGTANIPACPPAHIPSANPCPNWETQGNEPSNLNNITINLTAPYSGYPDSTSGPSGYASWYSVYYQDSPDGNYKILSANDQFSKAAGWFSKAESPNSFSLDYSNYYSNYPYDTHKVTLDYSAYYNRERYVANTSVAYYSCNGYVQVNNSTCTSTASAYPYCSSGIYGGNGDCYSGPYYPASSSSCGYTYCVIGPASCPVGYSLESYYPYYCTETVYYPGSFLGYAWQLNSTAYDYSYVNTSSNTIPPSMPACYNRNYKLAPQDGTISFYSGTPENPSGIDYSSTVNTNFSEVDGPGGKIVLEPGQVQSIQSQVAFRVYHTDNSGQTQWRTAVNIPTYYLTSNYGSTGSGPVTKGKDSGPQLQDYAPAQTSIPPLEYGDIVCADLTVNNPYGQVAPEGWQQQNVTPPYSVDQVNSAGATDSWPQTGSTPSGSTTGGVCTSYLAAKPYMKIYGGDAVAGADSMDTNLCYSSYAGIAAYNSGSGNGYAGSGTTEAAVATRAVSGFASGQIIAALTQAHNLTFANTPGSGYGYYTQGAPPCNGPLSFSQIGQQAVAGSMPTGNLLALPPPLLGGSRPTFINIYLSPGATIGSAALPLIVGQGEHVIIYSSGSVTIDGNIEFATLHGIRGASDLPTLQVIAGSDINILHSVTNLAGNYITSGTINDCSDVPVAHYAPDAATPGIANCGQKLTVQGSFQGGSVVLARTNGSIHQASAAYNGVPGDPYAGEEFDYLPNSWIIPSTAPALTVQSISSLPPIF